MRNIERYAMIFMDVAKDCASQQSTKCTLAEVVFEKELFFLLSLAQDQGVSLQDVVVITATALAVQLTKPETATVQPRKTVVTARCEMWPANVLSLSSAHSR